MSDLCPYWGQSGAAQHRYRRAKRKEHPDRARRRMVRDPGDASAETLDRLAVRLISLNVPQTAFAAGVAMESGNTGTVCCASG